MYFLLTFAEGVLTFVSPCILPMLPVYFLYLAGESTIDAVYASRRPGRLVKNAAGFVTGFTLVFILLGATVTSFGFFLSSHRGLLEKISGLLMIIFGLNFVGILKIPFLNMTRRIDYQFKSLSFVTSVLFGIVFALGWSPCLSTFLGSALALASNSKTLAEGILLLLLFSLGLGLPFILTSIIFDRIKGTFRQIQAHSRLISAVSGILLIAAGILVFLGKLKYLS